MQNDKVKVKRRRLIDFPELQVGFPERNDVSFPEEEIVRVASGLVDAERASSPRNRSIGRGQKLEGTEVSCA